MMAYTLCEPFFPARFFLSDHGLLGGLVDSSAHRHGYNTHDGNMVTGGGEMP